MGNAGICPRCGGKGWYWDGEKEVLCRKCDGRGVLQPRGTA